MRRLAVLKKLANAEKMGNADQVKRLKSRLKDFPEDPAESEPEKKVKKAPAKAAEESEALDGAE